MMMGVLYQGKCMKVTNLPNNACSGAHARIAQAQSAVAAPREHRDKQEKEFLQREIESTDGRIDRLVYELSPEGDDIWVDGR
jgi:hypothetical protein